MNELDKSECILGQKNIQSKLFLHTSTQCLSDHLSNQLYNEVNLFHW